MQFSRMLRVGAVIAAASLTLAACGGGDDGGSGEKVTIGIKFDQPGLALKQPDGSFAGFDVDVAKYVAKELGYSEEQIEFKEAQSSERENLIQKGDVDFIVATYSITDERKQKVDFAGPYFIAGQSLLVRADDNTITGPDAMDGKKLCSVTGSTPAQKIKAEHSKKVQLQEFGKYSACVGPLKNGQLDAMTTDDVILAGFAAQNPGAFKLVGETFSEERYGIGLKKGDTELKGKINAALQKMFDDGAWKAAIKKNLGPAGYEAPEPPAITEK